MWGVRSLGFRVFGLIEFRVLRPRILGAYCKVFRVVQVSGFIELRGLRLYVGLKA